MKFIIYLLVLGFVSPYAFANIGGESSGGGPSVFCPNSTSPEGVAQLYDFFEARIRRGWNIAVTNSASKEVQAEYILKKLESIDSLVAQEVRVQYANIQKNIYYLPDGIMMNNVHDLGSFEAPIVPVGCQLTYAAFFEGTGQLSVARLLYDRFTETEKAALLIHEALYAVAREMTQQKDSRSTRIVNAFLFSRETQVSSIVQEALETMKLQISAKILPVQMNSTDRKLFVRASCGVVSDKDTYHWGSSVVMWKGGPLSKETADGFLSPRLSIDKRNINGKGESEISFNDTTRTILFDANSFYGTGACEDEPLEIYYAGQKVGSIPYRTSPFAVRLFPVILPEKTL